MNCTIELHDIHPLIDRVFPLAEAIDAHRKLQSGSHDGKVVISAADDGEPETPSLG